MTKEYLICPICGAQTSDYFRSTSGNLITDVKCTNRKCFFSSNYVPINTWDRFMKMVEKCASLESENKLLNAALDKAVRKMYDCTGSCPNDVYGWRHPRTCGIRCEELEQPDGWVHCWREYALAEAEEEK